MAMLKTCGLLVAALLLGVMGVTEVALLTGATLADDSSVPGQHLVAGISLAVVSIAAAVLVLLAAFDRMWQAKRG